ncbi:hypothetical protein FKW77_002409 [Venturia effusa]|uniref:Uncharacterized protein n=1 Tax=Venturia effusa TaxID=50376 RepID=A0A517LAH8_9PEZI|nr:hypothetical protein FKW77_002409 [Venturia effusa]
MDHYHYPPDQPYRGVQAPYHRPDSTTDYGRQQQPAPGYATPPPGNQWQQPPPPNLQSEQPQYGQQGQQSPAPGYHPGIYGRITRTQGQLPSPPPMYDPQTIYGQQPIQQSEYNYGGQSAPAQPSPHRYGHRAHSSVSSIAPSIHHNEDAQQGQWGQPLQYSTHPPVDRYGPQDGQHGPPQPPQQGYNVPQAHQHDTTHPHPPSATPGGPYFPPAQGQRSGAPASESIPYSQVDGQQNIPPSLSGHGVAAYISTNTNPAQGVYLPPPPPPPESVSAWSQRQHDPLDPEFSRFEYTPRPPPKPQEYGSQTPVGQYDNAQQQGYPPPPPRQAPPMQTHGQGPPRSQPYQQYSTSGPEQQAYESSLGQPIHEQPPHRYHQQQLTLDSAQHNPAQSFTTSTQRRDSSNLPQSQYGQAQTWTEGQHVGSRPGSVQQTQQPYVPPQQHTRSSSNSHAPVPYHQRVCQEDATPVSPLQHRQSISLDNSNDPNLNTSGIPSRSESQASRKAVSLQPIQEPRPAKPLANASNAFALGGFGGPSDWEHFGSAPEIDDTAMYGVKSDKEAPPFPHMASVELPTGSPIREKRSDSQASTLDDWEAGPSAVIESDNSQRPFPTSGSSGQQPPISWTPTPPVPQSMHQPPHSSSATPPTSAAIVMDDPDYIPPMPSTPPLVGTSLNERKPIVLGGSTVTHPAPQTSTSFVMGDSVGISPSQSPIPQSQQPASLLQNHQSSPLTASTPDDQRQQSQVQPQSTPPRLRSTMIDTQLLQNAQREVEELQARLASAQGALAEKDTAISQKDSALAQKDSAIAQNESAMAQKDAAIAEKNAIIAQKEASIQQAEISLKEMSEKQSSVQEKQEAELVKIRAENLALVERVRRAELLLTASKSAYVLEKGKLEKTVHESQTALTTALAEAVGLKKQLEEEKIKASAPADIAPGLEPWFKGSLERYKEMLYTESKSLPLTEKLNVFMSFVTSESCLRGIDLPFGPAGQIKGFPQQELPQPTIPLQTGSVPVQESKKPAMPQLSRINSSLDSEGFIMVDTDEDIQYSPGGRPVMRPKPKKAASVRSINSVSETGVAELSAAEVASHPQAGPSDPQYQPFRRNSFETPPAVGSSSSPKIGAAISSPQKATGPQQPAYMKLISPNDQTVTPPKAQSTPPAIYRPVSQWTQPASASGNRPRQPPIEENLVTKQVLGKRGGSRDESMVLQPLMPQPLQPKGAPTQPQSVPPQLAQQTAQHSAQQEPQNMFQKKPQEPRTMASMPAVRPQPKKKHSFASLMKHLAFLLPPVKMADSETASRNEPSLCKAFASFPSDYNFISSLTKTWETEATATRSRHEADRRKRQEALETRTNELYDDDEIGYGDFDTLESQAKETEQRLKAKEDAEEYDSYGQQVFEPVFRTLQEQIGGLMALQADVQNLATRAETGLEALSERPEDLGLAKAMALLIKVHTALEERHAEVFKAVQERDRRYKRTQTKPLYAKGDIAAMKRVEKSFEHAEKSHEVKAKIEKAERCKRLCRIIEANMERGISVNEDYAHDILGAAEGDASLVRPEDKDAFRRLVVRARDVLKEVYGSTTQLLKHFEFVDMELNECEYAVSVASARLKGDPDAFFERLEREKKNEDEKLNKEWTGRVKEVDEHAKAADKQIEAILERLSGAAGSGRARAGTAGGSSALKDAKRRNGDL